MPVIRVGVDGGLRQNETILMHYIDPHIHMVSRITDDDLRGARALQRWPCRNTLLWSEP